MEFTKEEKESVKRKSKYVRIQRRRVEEEILTK